MKSAIKQLARRSNHLMRLLGMAAAGCLPASSCGMNIQDAVADGLAQFVTQATVSVLNSAVGLDAGDGTNNGSGDPFEDDNDGSPVQP